MWADGKDDAHAIADCAKISSICAGVPSSTTCTSWPVLKHFLLSFRPLLDYLTGALAELLLNERQRHSLNGMLDRTRVVQTVGMHGHSQCLPCTRARGGGADLAGLKGTPGAHQATERPGQRRLRSVRCES
jgi:hypothetical protein